MAHQRDKWIAAAAAAFVFATLPACKRGDDKSAEPKVVELPVPVAATGTAPAPAQPLEVKRHGDQERPLTGSVRVTGDEVKAYADADNKGEPMTTLAKSTLIKRKASFGDWTLVEYPTPRGDTDLGWVETKDLAGAPEAVVDTKKVQPTDGGTTADAAAAKNAMEEKTTAEDKTAKDAGKTESTAKKDAGKTESTTKKDAGKTESTTKKDAGKTESTTKKDAGKTESTTKKDAGKTAK
jgi:hypothetical protein